MVMEKEILIRPWKETDADNHNTKDKDAVVMLTLLITVKWKIIMWIIGNDGSSLQ